MWPSFVSGPPNRDAWQLFSLSSLCSDLSETSITSLPADHFASLGLTKLWLKNTATLKVFPPVYNFQSIKEARLTYSYHCCAFRFPTTHNPEAYAKWMEEQQRACARTTSTQKSEQSPTVSGVRRRRTAVADWQLWKEARRHRRSYAVLRDEDGGGGPGTTEPSPLDPWWGHFHVPEGEVGSQPKDSPTLSLSRDTMGSAAPTSSHEYAEGFEDSIHPGGGSKDVGPQNEQELGRFLASTVDPPESKKEHCGNFSKNYREVVCYPEPDAFNPCEDVMGNVGLRIAVWFVVVAAVLGNLAVMVVLMSSRFKMTVSKFLMCNLAFADFCMGVYLFIIACMDLHTIGEYFNYAIFWQEGTWVVFFVQSRARCLTSFSPLTRPREGKSEC